jgi:hypothetical protein
MDLVTADDVIRAIELYHEGGALRYLPGPGGAALPGGDPAHAA